MKKIFLFAIIAAFILLNSCTEPASQYVSKVIGTGKMPHIAAGKKGDCYIAYGTGDSILCSVSADEGKTFSAPALVAVLPHLMAYSMRGPQISATAEGAVITACTKEGNIFSYTKDNTGSWSAAVRVNDIDTVAKEALMALGADGDLAFAVWLDLRTGHNEIAGATSRDGGKTWLKNQTIYSSPDTMVCPCCKPSVVVKGKQVTIMFRNHLQGNRDLYLVHSADGGQVFGQAEKLGTNSWKLDACPMDGGGLAIDDHNMAETVWRRNDSIFSCRIGQDEKLIAKGRNCSIESVDGKNVYAWTENGEVIVKKPGGQSVNLGKGQLPLLKKINNEHVLCAWENDKKVMVQTVSL